MPSSYPGVIQDGGIELVYGKLFPLKSSTAVSSQLTFFSVSTSLICLLRDFQGWEPRGGSDGLVRRLWFHFQLLSQMAVGLDGPGSKSTDCRLGK